MKYERWDNMNDQVIICSSCGAKCAADDLFCKVCFQTLTQSENSDVQAIDGITNEDLDKFLEKNGEYYIDRFSRTERKHFLQLNFAALFFGPTWFFIGRCIGLPWRMRRFLFCCLRV